MFLIGEGEDDRDVKAGKRIERWIKREIVGEATGGLISRYHNSDDVAALARTEDSVLSFDP